LGHAPCPQHFRVEGCARALEWGLRRLINTLITPTYLHKPNNKLVSLQLEHLWCTNEPRADMDSQDSPQPGLGEVTTFPLTVYYVPNHRTNTQMFPKLGLSQLWRPITLCGDLQLKWRLKQSCILHWERSNNMSHTTYMQENRGDSRLLMVKSQIVNLTSNPSFGHNLCSKYPNGSCEPILDIYVPRYFQW
jgi:hypothetical protein